MSNSIQKKVKYVMSIVFEIPIKDINEDSSAENIGSWDSLKHMNFIVALEEAFKVEFTEAEIPEMLDYLSILKILKDK